MTAHSVRIAGVDCFRWAPAVAGAAPNFGDELAADIVARMVAAAGIPADADPRVGRRLLSVGSVLHFSRHGDVVWGSGVNGKVYRQVYPTTLDVRAVRGPLTRAALMAHGIAAPEVYGDPALLLADLVPELRDVRRTRGVVVVPNLNELDRFGEDIVSPLGPSLHVAAEIATGEFVTGTSLHALIVADALGIPSRPVLPGAEDAFKYVDYYLGTGRGNIEFATSVEDAIRLGPVPPPRFSPDALRDAFPIGLWHGQTAESDDPPSFGDLRSAALADRDALSALIGVDGPGGDALGRLDDLIARDIPAEGIPRELAAQWGIPQPHLGWTRKQKREIELSVIIPTHDVRPWVEETIGSVLAQNVERMEVLVVDDHSTDGTQAAVLAAAEGDPRVRLIDAIERGGGSARNVGLDNAAGRFVIFCDGDDIVPDGAYAALVGSLQASGSDIAFGDYLKFSPSATWRPTASMSAFSRPAAHIAFHDEPSLLYSRPCWNKAYTRSLWENESIRFPDVARSNDIVPVVRTYVTARRVDIVPQIVYLYRERPGATSMTARASSTESILSYLEQERICADLVHKDPRLGAAYANLVYDRDAYVHVARYLLRDDLDETEFATVADAVDALLRATPEPSPDTHPLKRLMLLLAARGALAGARAAAALHETPHDRELDRFSTLAALVTACIDAGLSLSMVRDLVARPISEELNLRGGDGQADPDGAAFVALVSQGLGTSILDDVPEIRSARVEWDAVIDLRNRTRGEVTAIAGRGTVVVEGTVADRGGVTPVLHGSRRGTEVIVRPSRVRWTHDAEVHRWRAEFPLFRLPMHVDLRPALWMREEQAVVVARGPAELPEYDRFRNVLIDPDAVAATIRRRRSWALRGARIIVASGYRRLYAVRDTERVRRIERPLRRAVGRIPGTRRVRDAVLGRLLGG